MAELKRPQGPHSAIAFIAVTLRAQLPQSPPVASLLLSNLEDGPGPTQLPDLVSLDLGLVSEDGGGLSRGSPICSQAAF